MEVARVWINGQMALSHRTQHICYRRKDRTTFTKKSVEYDIAKLKPSILGFFPISFREPPIFVRALTNTSSILIIGLFVPKILF